MILGSLKKARDFEWQILVKIISLIDLRRKKMGDGNESSQTHFRQVLSDIAIPLLFSRFARWHPTYALSISNQDAVYSIIQTSNPYEVGVHLLEFYCQVYW